MSQYILPRYAFRVVITLFALVLALIIGLLPDRAQAEDFDVGCTNGVGDVAGLIAAINTANGTADLDVITLPSNCIFTLTTKYYDDDLIGAGGLPQIVQPLLIVGNGSTIQRDPAAPAFRIFFTHNDLTLRQVTIANGYANSPTEGGLGGGVVIGIMGLGNGHTLTVEDSTFRNNRAFSGGAVMGGYGATVLIENSTFSGNHAVVEGGGTIFVGEFSALSLSHSTLVNNHGTSTIVSMGTLHITNSLLGGPVSGTECAFGGTAITSAAYNIATDTTCGSGFTVVDINNVGISPLANNGGSTQTHALLAGSPAINAGDPNFAGTLNDQRGSGYLRVDGGRTDIGAYEADIATVGGTVTGLEGTGLILALNGALEMVIATDGPFTFPANLVVGESYTVTVSAQPINRPQTCTVTNGSGSADGVNKTNVAVTCVVEKRTLTVVPSGNGSGTVTSAPAAIDCGATCSAEIELGSPITLTATTTASSTFLGWSGECAGIGDCVLEMTVAKTVTTTFVTKTFALNVSTDGTGAGTVTGAPDNTTAIEYGTVITLTAVPSTTSAFVGWSGDCSGVATCTLTMTTTHAVTATFDLLPEGTFDVSIGPNSSGGIVEVEEVDPTAAGGISMAQTTFIPAGFERVTTRFPEGTVLRVLAIANSGFVFGGWTGDLSGLVNPLPITVDASIAAGADFVPIRLRLPIILGNFE